MTTNKIKLAYVYPAIPYDEYLLLLWALGYASAKREDKREQIDKLIRRLLDDAETLEVKIVEEVKDVL